MKKLVSVFTFKKMAAQMEKAVVGASQQGEEETGGPVLIAKLEVIRCYNF